MSFTQCNCNCFVRLHRSVYRYDCVALFCRDYFTLQHTSTCVCLLCGHLVRLCCLSRPIYNHFKKNEMNQNPLRDRATKRYSENRKSEHNYSEKGGASVMIKIGAWVLGRVVSFRYL